MIFSGHNVIGTDAPHSRGLFGRRSFLLLSSAAILSPALNAHAARDAMTDTLWKQWNAEWKRMEGIAMRRGWQMTPLQVGPSVSSARISLIEMTSGLTFPPQLRQLLTSCSGRVIFSWHIPPHLQPLEQKNLPTSSANRGAIWDIDHIETMAIPQFGEWKQSLADVDMSEAPNNPQMWENQFPFYSLVNGDLLTIDMSNPAGPQPVRYFSHELEMLHGMALAPDFFSFVTEMSKLGFAGTEWASWMGFGEEDGDHYYLRADSAGGKAWLDWLERDPARVDADEPRPSIVEETAADRALLSAARNNSLSDVTAALSAGARPDVIWNRDWLLETGNWDEEFATAVTYATRHDNIPMLEKLHAAGANLDTRRLSVMEAAWRSRLETVEWLIGKGARVNGWKDERYSPLRRLISDRGSSVDVSREALEARIRVEIDAAYPPSSDPQRIQRKQEALELILKDRLASFTDMKTYLAILEAMLMAGADPDAPGDNGTTQLMWANTPASEALLRHGADVMARNSAGWTALHYAHSPEKIRALVGHGADINATAGTPNESRLTFTPLQVALMSVGRGRKENARTLLELGADPKRRDGQGRNTLCYCISVEAFEMMKPYGLDPLERLPDGKTLIHNLLQMTSIRANFPNEVALLDLFLSLGIDINATDNDGATVLHLAAPDYDTAADLQLLLDRGADKNIASKQGKRPFDLVPKSQTDILALLR